MREQNSLFIIVTTKEINPAIIGLFYWIWWTLLSTLCHHRSVPTPWSPPSPSNSSSYLWTLFFFMIITTNEINQEFIGVFYCIWWTLLSNLCHSRSAPTPRSPPPLLLLLLLSLYDYIISLTPHHHHYSLSKYLIPLFHGISTSYVSASR